MLKMNPLTFITGMEILSKLVALVDRTIILRREQGLHFRDQANKWVAPIVLLGNNMMGIMIPTKLIGHLSNKSNHNCLDPQCQKQQDTHTNLITSKNSLLKILIRKTISISAMECMLD